MKVIFWPLGSRHLIGADMLGDAAGLMHRDIRLADRIEKRGLAMVDMAHDRDHRRTRQQARRIVLQAFQTQLDVGFADALQAMAEFGDDQLGRILVEPLVDRRHDPHFHQGFDDVGAALGHAGGEILHRDALGDDDVSDHALILGLQQMGPSLLLPRPLDGGQRAHPLPGILVERLDDGDLAGAPARLVAARRQRLGRRPDAAALDLARRLFLFLGLGHGAARGAHHIGLDALDRGLALGLRHHRLFRHHGGGHGSGTGG